MRLPAGPGLPVKLLTLGILACLASLAVSLFMIRRNSTIMEEVNKAYSCRDFDESLGTYRMRPACTGTRNKGAGAVPFRINSEGFRDRDWGPRRSGVYRVALLGFSLWMGPGVTDEVSPGPLLEAELRARGHKGVEVINLSVEGYRLANHSVLFERYLEKYQPDLFVIGPINVETLDDDLVRGNGIEWSRDGRPVRLLSEGPRIYKDVQDQTWWGSARAYVAVVYKSVRYWRSHHRLQEIADPASRADAFVGPAAWLLRWMRETAAARRARVLVVWDGTEQAKRNRLGVDDWGWPQRLIGSINPRVDVDPALVLKALRVDGLSVVDLGGRLPGLATPELLIAKGPYYNQAGMREMARSVAEVLAGKLPAVPLEKAEPRERVRSRGSSK